MEYGYRLLTTCPVMTWRVEASPLPNFDIRKATDMQSFNFILTLTSQYEEALGANIVRLLLNSHAEHYLGYIDDHPIGIVTLFRDGKTGVVSNLATLDKYQRQGCGRSLMLRVMQRACEMELEQLVLGTSPAAERLYGSLGFKKQINIHMYSKDGRDISHLL